MDVVEFIEKAGYRILDLTNQYLLDISRNGESDAWKMVYLLTEAIEVVQNGNITDACSQSIISKLDAMCSLESATSTTPIPGVGEMSVDPLIDCAVFEVGGEANVCNLQIGDTVIESTNLTPTVTQFDTVSAEILNSVGDLTYNWEMYNGSTDVLILSRVGLVAFWQWDNSLNPSIYITLTVTDDICTTTKMITGYVYNRI